MSEATNILDYSEVLAFQAIATGAALLGSWLISWQVSPAVFGQYSLYMSLLGVASMLFISWPNAALLRYGREEWTRNGTIAHALTTRLWLFVLGGSLTALFAWRFDSTAARLLSTSDSPLRWIVVGALVWPLPDIGVYALLSTGRFKAYGYVPLVNRAAFVLGLLAMWWFRITPSWERLAACVIIASALSASATLIELPKRRCLTLFPSRAMAGKILIYSWAIPFGTASSYVVNWVDAWVIRLYMNIGFVGVYTWAYQVVSIAGLAFAPLATLMTPAMMDARVSGDFAAIQAHGDLTLRLVALLGIGGLALEALIFPVLSVAGGAHYQQAYLVILILLSVLPFQLVSYLVNPVSGAFESLVPRGMLISVVMAAANVAGDFVLVPTVGIVGAAISTWLAFLISEIMKIRLITGNVAGLRFPSISRFVPISLAMSFGTALLWIAGPLFGALLCVASSMAMLFWLRSVGLFCEADARWIEAQPIGLPLKTGLTRAFEWLAGGHGKISIETRAETRIS